MTSTAFDPKAAKYGPIVAIVNSASEPDKQYEVRHNPDGNLTCQCMGWRFNKESPRRCRHTDAQQGKGKFKVMNAGEVAAAKSVGIGQKLTDEAKRVSADILQYASGPRSRTQAIEYATKQIEEAIRKFMGKIPAEAAAAAVDVTARGVRMITLDD